jgi:hypothetical protein
MGLNQLLLFNIIENKSKKTRLTITKDLSKRGSQKAMNYQTSQLPPQQKASAF